MKNNSNACYNRTNILKDKDSFKIKDLIKILKLLDKNAEIEFGVMTSRNTIEFAQCENFIFELHCFTGEDIENENYTLQIITKLINKIK